MMNQISNALKSTVTEVVMLSLICCMVTSTVALQSSGSWSDALVAVAIIEFVMLVGWLGWLTYIFLTKKTLSVMPAKPRSAFEWCSGILFSYWLVMSWVPALAMPWVIVAAWVAFAACMMFLFVDKSE